MKLGCGSKVGAWIITDFFFFVTEALRYLNTAVWIKKKRPPLPEHLWLPTRFIGRQWRTQQAAKASGGSWAGKLECLGRWSCESNQACLGHLSIRTVNSWGQARRGGSAVFILGTPTIASCKESGDDTSQGELSGMVQTSHTFLESLSGSAHPTLNMAFGFKSAQNTRPLSLYDP